MHTSSYDKMTKFRRAYLRSREGEEILIYDLGSQNINGCYRPIFDAPRWNYVGLDMTEGENVDLVLQDPYNWREIEAGCADVLISGQTFEHAEFFWLTMQQIARALRVGGLCCIIAPSSGPEHRHPVDCWRVYPDGLRALARYVGFEVLHASTQWEDLPQYDQWSNQWHDSMLVARKPG